MTDLKRKVAVTVTDNPHGLVGDLTRVSIEWPVGDKADTAYDALDAGVDAFKEIMGDDYRGGLSVQVYWIEPPVEGA